MNLDEVIDVIVKAEQEGKRLSVCTRAIRQFTVQSVNRLKCLPHTESGVKSVRVSAAF